eukprot:2727964-Amphidinium_carterae.1
MLTQQLAAISAEGQSFANMIEQRITRRAGLRNAGGQADVENRRKVEPLELEVLRTALERCASTCPLKEPEFTTTADEQTSGQCKAWRRRKSSKKRFLHAAHIDQLVSTEVQKALTTTETMKQDIIQAAQHVQEQHHRLNVEYVLMRQAVVDIVQHVADNGVEPTVEIGTVMWTGGSSPEGMNEYIATVAQ